MAHGSWLELHTMLARSGCLQGQLVAGVGLLLRLRLRALSCMRDDRTSVSVSHFSVCLARWMASIQQEIGPPTTTMAPDINIPQRRRRCVGASVRCSIQAEQLPPPRSRADSMACTASPSRYRSIMVLGSCRHHPGGPRDGKRAFVDVDVDGRCAQQGEGGACSDKPTWRARSRRPPTWHSIPNVKNAPSSGLTCLSRCGR
jgi:hypothetical protein